MLVDIMPHVATPAPGTELLVLTGLLPVFANGKFSAYVALVFGFV